MSVSFQHMDLTCSIHGMFTNIYGQNEPNVGKHSIPVYGTLGDVPILILLQHNVSTKNDIADNEIDIVYARFQLPICYGSIFAGPSIDVYSIVEMLGVSQNFTKKMEVIYTMWVHNLFGYSL